MNLGLVWMGIWTWAAQIQTIYRSILADMWQIQICYKYRKQKELQSRISFKISSRHIKASQSNERSLWNILQKVIELCWEQALQYPASVIPVLTRCSLSPSIQCFQPLFFFSPFWVQTSLSPSQLTSVWKDQTITVSKIQENVKVSQQTATKVTQL